MLGKSNSLRAVLLSRKCQKVLTTAMMDKENSYAEREQVEMVGFYSHLINSLKDAEDIDYGGAVAITMRIVRDKPAFAKLAESSLLMAHRMLNYGHQSFSINVVGIPGYVQSMALRANSSNARLARLCCEVLNRLIDNEGDIVSMQKVEGLKVLLLVLRNHSLSMDVLTAVAGLLGRVAQYEAGASAMLCDGAEVSLALTDMLEDRNELHLMVGTSSHAHTTHSPKGHGGHRSQGAAPLAEKYAQPEEARWTLNTDDDQAVNANLALHEKVFTALLNLLMLWSPATENAAVNKVGGGSTQGGSLVTQGHIVQRTHEVGAGSEGGGMLMEEEEQPVVAEVATVRGGDTGGDKGDDTGDDKWGDANKKSTVEDAVGMQQHTVAKPKAGAGELHLPGETLVGEERAEWENSIIGVASAALNEDPYIKRKSISKSKKVAPSLLARSLSKHGGDESERAKDAEGRGHSSGSLTKTPPQKTSTAFASSPSVSRLGVEDDKHALGIADSRVRQSASGANGAAAVQEQEQEEQLQEERRLQVQVQVMKILSCLALKGGVVSCTRILDGGGAVALMSTYARARPSASPRSPKEMRTRNSKAGNTAVTAGAPGTSLGLGPFMHSAGAPVDGISMMRCAMEAITTLAADATTCATLEKRGAISMFTSALKGQVHHRILIITTLTFLVRTRSVGYTSAKNNEKLVPAVVFAMEAHKDSVEVQVLAFELFRRVAKMEADMISTREQVHEEAEKKYHELKTQHDQEHEQRQHLQHGRQQFKQHHHKPQPVTEQAMAALNIKIASPTNSSRGVGAASPTKHGRARFKVKKAGVFNGNEVLAGVLIEAGALKAVTTITKLHAGNEGLLLESSALLMQLLRLPETAAALGAGGGTVTPTVSPTSSTGEEETVPLAQVLMQAVEQQARVFARVGLELMRCVLVAGLHPVGKSSKKGFSPVLRLYLEAGAMKVLIKLMSHHQINHMLQLAGARALAVLAGVATTHLATTFSGRLVAVDLSTVDMRALGVQVVTGAKSSSNEISNENSNENSESPPSLELYTESHEAVRLGALLAVARVVSPAVIPDEDTNTNGSSVKGVIGLQEQTEAIRILRGLVDYSTRFAQQMDMQQQQTSGGSSGGRSGSISGDAHSHHGASLHKWLSLVVGAVEAEAVALAAKPPAAAFQRQDGNRDDGSGSGTRRAHFAAAVELLAQLMSDSDAVGSNNGNSSTALRGSDEEKGARKGVLGAGAVTMLLRVLAVGSTSIVGNSTGGSVSNIGSVVSKQQASLLFQLACSGMAALHSLVLGCMSPALAEARLIPALLQGGGGEASTSSFHGDGSGISTLLRLCNPTAGGASAFHVLSEGEGESKQQQGLLLALMTRAADVLQLAVACPKIALEMVRTSGNEDVRLSAPHSSGSRMGTPMGTPTGTPRTLAGTPRGTPRGNFSFGASAGGSRRRGRQQVEEPNEGERERQLVQHERDVLMMQRLTAFFRSFHTPPPMAGAITDAADGSMVPARCTAFASATLRFIFNLLNHGAEGISVGVDKRSEDAREKLVLALLGCGAAQAVVCVMEQHAEGLGAGVDAKATAIALSVTALVSSSLPPSGKYIGITQQQCMCCLKLLAMDVAHMVFLATSAAAAGTTSTVCRLIGLVLNAPLHFQGTGVTDYSMHRRLSASNPQHHNRKSSRATRKSSSTALSAIVPVFAAARKFSRSLEGGTGKPMPLIAPLQPLQSIDDAIGGFEAPCELDQAELVTFVGAVCSAVAKITPDGGGGKAGTPRASSKAGGAIVSADALAGRSLLKPLSGHQVRRALVQTMLQAGAIPKTVRVLHECVGNKMLMLRSLEILEALAAPVEDEEEDEEKSATEEKEEEQGPDGGGAPMGREAVVQAMVDEGSIVHVRSCCLMHNDAQVVLVASALVTTAMLQPPLETPVLNTLMMRLFAEGGVEAMMGSVISKPHFFQHTLLALGVVQRMAAALGKSDKGRKRARKLSQAPDGEREAAAEPGSADGHTDKLVESHAVAAVLSSLSVVHAGVQKCACQTMLKLVLGRQKLSMMLLAKQQAVPALLSLYLEGSATGDKSFKVCVMPVLMAMIKSFVPSADDSDSAAAAVTFAVEDVDISLKEIIAAFVRMLPLPARPGEKISEADRKAAKAAAAKTVDDLVKVGCIDAVCSAVKRNPKCTRSLVQYFAFIRAVVTASPSIAERLVSTYGAVDVMIAGMEAHCLPGKQGRHEKWAEVMGSSFTLIKDLCQEGRTIAMLLHDIKPDLGLLLQAMTQSKEHGTLARSNASPEAEVEEDAACGIVVSLSSMVQAAQDPTVSLEFVNPIDAAVEGAAAAGTADVGNGSLLEVATSLLSHQHWPRFSVQLCALILALLEHGTTPAQIINSTGSSAGGTAGGRLVELLRGQLKVGEPLGYEAALDGDAELAQQLVSSSVLLDVVKEGGECLSCACFFSSTDCGVLLSFPAACGGCGYSAAGTQRKFCGSVLRVVGASCRRSHGAAGRPVAPVALHRRSG
jgi:hypothetical protein